MKILIAMILMISLGLAGTQVFARVMANPAASSAAVRYDKTGIVHEIDVAARSIVIDGQRYFFASATVPVRTAAGERYSGRLKKNARIGFNVSNEGPNRSANVSEVWVLDEPKQSDRKK